MFDFSPETGLLMPILSFAGLTTLAREVTTRKLLDHQGQIPLSLINGLVNLVGPAIAIGAEYLINLL